MRTIYHWRNTGEKARIVAGIAFPPGKIVTTADVFSQADRNALTLNGIELFGTESIEWPPPRAAIPAAVALEVERAGGATTEDGLALHVERDADGQPMLVGDGAGEALPEIEGDGDVTVYPVTSVPTEVEPFQPRGRGKRR